MRVWPTRSRARRARVVALGAEHRDQVERRRAAVTRLVGTDRAAAARVATSPAGYLLAHDSGDVARHCTLLSDLPPPGEVRAVVTPGRGRGEWHLDVTSRDRPGLLAAFTGVLAGSGLDVVQAVLATWADGGALEAFVVKSTDPPDAVALQDAFEASLDKPLSSPPVAEAHVTFDDVVSALYTRCDVRAGDRPGLLHALAVAITSAGADVHAARVTTVEGVARDRFDLSDSAGHKLDATLKEAIRAGVRGGLTRFRLRRRP
jgi:[protein-PII] uridylyltransferase